jgi:hypothetical protein
MNERIQELEQQALSIVLNGNDPDSDVDKMYIPSEFTKKFAELIVQECAEVGSKFSQAHPLDIQYQIKRHFGVEE